MIASTKSFEPPSHAAPYVTLDRCHSDRPALFGPMMTRLILAFVIVAVAPALVSAQTDPLSNSYKPAMDCTPTDYPSNIALSGPLVKLRRDSGSPSGVYGAAPCITIYAVPNEFQSFQVHVQAPSGGYPALNVTMSALTKSTGPGGNFTIPAPSSTNADIVVYREAYMHVSLVTATNSPAFYGSTGYYPDPLIPAIDPYYHQTTAAFPVAVSANQNQSAWVDVYVPQSALSGWYSGTVTILNGGTTLATMPVLLGVWQWPSSVGGYMPSSATLHSMEFTGYLSLCRQAYGLNGTNCSTYPGSQGSADYGDVVSKDDLAVQLLDNRLTLSSVTAYFPTAADTGLENGTSTGRVTRIMPASRQGPVRFPNGTFNSSTVSSWMNKFSANGWLASANSTFDYLVDEPGTTCSNWTTAIANAAASRLWSTPNLPMLITTTLQWATTCGGTNAVDWMIVGTTCLETSNANPCPALTSGVNYRSTYNTWLTGNCCGGSGPTRQIWSYLACGQAGTCSSGYPASNGSAWPNYDVDAYPVANRAVEWMTFRNQQVGELYYLLDGCFYYPCGQGTPGGTTNDPWSSVYEYGNNGDGNLIYPGSNSTNTSSLASQVGVSIPIWIPSMRIKMMRDGMQDYEYLNLLTNQGNGSLVQSEISSWITNGYTFNVNPSGLTAARQALGQAIHQLTYPVSLQPPPSVSGTVQP
jgi:hypothetical protein